MQWSSCCAEFCKKWKQPIAFFSDSAMGLADLQRNVKNIVKAVKTTGIKIVASISDQMTTNSAAISGLQAARWCGLNNVEIR